MSSNREIDSGCELNASEMCQPCARLGIAIAATTKRDCLYKQEQVCGDCAAEIDAGREP